jgi:hypothetical protein
MAVNVPRLRIRLKDSAREHIGRAVLAALDKQAAEGLGVGRSGSEVTLHGRPQTAAIWRDVTVSSEALHFNHHLARLLSEYGADKLTPSNLEALARELAPFVQASLEMVQEK